MTSFIDAKKEDLISFLNIVTVTCEQGYCISKYLNVKECHLLPHQLTVSAE